MMIPDVSGLIDEITRTNRFTPANDPNSTGLSPDLSDDDLNELIEQLEKNEKMHSSNSYILITDEFPITNHARADERNLGWIKGVFDDGKPFEAEMWEYDGRICVSIILPVHRSVRREKNNEERNKLKKCLVPFCFQEEFTHGGILHLGMVDDGQETCSEVVEEWVEYLEAKEFLYFVSERRDGAVLYEIDASGNLFTEVIVTLEDKERIYAIVDVKWNAFPTNEKKQKKKTLRVVR